MINAYITNLGKYNEGELCGEYLKLPAEKTDVQALLARIGVDGVLYEEVFITDYETDVDGLCKYVPHKDRYPKARDAKRPNGGRRRGDNSARRTSGQVDPKLKP